MRAACEDLNSTVQLELCKLQAGIIYDMREDKVFFSSFFHISNTHVYIYNMTPRDASYGRRDSSS